MSSVIVLSRPRLTFAKQQQQQPVQQPEPQAQQYAQQDYEGDTSMYDYDNSGQRPSSRGSKQHMENGNNYGAPSNSHGDQSGHGYTIQYSGNQRRDGRDDDEDEMW